MASEERCSLVNLGGTLFFGAHDGFPWDEDVGKYAIHGWYEMVVAWMDVGMGV